MSEFSFHPEAEIDLNEIWAFRAEPDGVELLLGTSIYTLGGSLLRKIDSAALDVRIVSSIAPITSGRRQGLYVVSNSEESELVVFSLP
jgi:hypothetical protein